MPRRTASTLVVRVMRSYLVGGAVRDRLLERPVHERDWVVTGATPAQLIEQGFRPKDPTIPVFTHPETGEEYALARRERKLGKGHKGFEFEYGPGITLEDDLARRDLTINAMAQDPEGGLVDPWNGLEDLRARLLRHVTPAFAEDPLRVLRLARFAAELAEYGFSIAPETEQLATRMSSAADLLSLTPGRVWREMSKALRSIHPEIFLRCLGRFGALPRLMPWLAAPQDPDAPAQALECAASLSAEPEVRLAAALAAAARHGAAGVPPEWPLPAGVRSLSALVLRHPLPDTRDANGVLNWLEGVDAWRRGERFGQLMAIWRSICPGQERDVARLEQARAASLKVPPPGQVKDPRAAVRAARLEQLCQFLDDDVAGNAR